MAKKSAAKTEAATPEPEAQAPAEPKITKSEAARQAIAEGVDNPTEAVAFIKAKFKLDMTPQHFSAIKGGEKKKTDVPKGKPGRKPKVAAEVAAPVTKKKAVASEPDVLAGLETVKALVGQFGADKLRKMVDLMD